MVSSSSSNDNGEGSSQPSQHHSPRFNIEQAGEKEDPIASPERDDSILNDDFLVDESAPNPAR